MSAIDMGWALAGLRYEFEKGPLKNHAWSELLKSKGYQIDEREFTYFVELKRKLDAGEIEAESWLRKQIDDVVAKGPETSWPTEADEAMKVPAAADLLNTHSKDRSRALYTRGLTPIEKSYAYKIFKDTIPYDEIEIVVMPQGIAASVVGNTIFFPADALDAPYRLMHELVHVWQGHHPKMMACPKDGYGNYEPLDRVYPFQDLDPEQQAQVMTGAVPDGILEPGGPIQYSADDPWRESALIRIAQAKDAFEFIENSGPGTKKPVKNKCGF